MRTNRLLTLVTIIAAGTLALACGDLDPGDSVESIQEALELEDGGYDMNDELPRFNLPSLDMADVDLAQVGEIPEEGGLDTYTGLLPGSTDPCPSGYLKGEWKPLVPGKPYGVFLGKWVTANGKVQGHIKGVYGQNLMGIGVFFGKYIDDTGKFRGLLKGLWGNGFFKGRWHGVAGPAGELGGVYGKGLILGKWRAYCASCNSVCKPGYVRAPGFCFCVPAKVTPCLKGQCPQGMLCDPCPKHPACQPGQYCPAVCGPPVCVNKPAAPAPQK